MGSLFLEGSGRIPAGFKARVTQQVPLSGTHFNLGLSNFRAGKAERQLRKGQVLGSAFAFLLEEGERPSHRGGRSTKLGKGRAVHSANGLEIAQRRKGRDLGVSRAYGEQEC